MMREALRESRLITIALCLVLAGCATTAGSGSTTLGSDARLRVAQAAEQSGDYPLADAMYAEAAA